MSKKLSVLLGLREKVETSTKNMLDDMFQKFKNKQGIFMGVRSTYEALDGFADDDTKRKYVHVSSTISEQLNWMREGMKNYFDVVFSIEKTNAQGVYAELVVDGENWGTYSTMELLRLKGILDGKLRALIGELPVRNEAVIWNKTTDQDYEGREIYSSPVVEGFAKTTIKNIVIVNDPHIKESPTRPPVVDQVTTQVNIGKYTHQEFSGATSMRERAELLKKYDKLQTAIVEALETANNKESTDSELGDRVISYLF